jgi:hypothetical protein
MTDRLQAHRAEAEGVIADMEERLRQPLAGVLGGMDAEELAIARDYLRGVIGPHLEARPGLRGLAALRVAICMLLSAEMDRRGMRTEIEIGELYRTVEL